MPLSDEHMKSLIKQGTRDAMMSDDVKALFNQLAYEAASNSVKRHLSTLGIGPDSDDAENFRKNLDFVNRTRERCEKVADKIVSLGVAAIFAVVVGLLWLGVKTYVPSLNTNDGPAPQHTIQK